MSWLIKDNEYLNIDKDKLKELIKISSYAIPSYLKDFSGVNFVEEDLFVANPIEYRYIPNLSESILAVLEVIKIHMLEYIMPRLLAPLRAIHYVINLSETNLSEANLSRANLTNANLSGANLNGVNLSEVNLSGAVLIDIILYLFTWNENDTINNLKEWLGRLGFEVKKFEFNNNTLNITTDKEAITIELKENKAILKVGNYKEELLAFKENGKIRIYLPIKVDDETYAKGIILTYKKDEKSILKALENLPPNFRKIALRDNPNYKEIWSKYHGNNSQD